MQSYPIYPLSDGEITLCLAGYIPENAQKKIVPAYVFDILNDEYKIGTIDLRIGFNENIYYGGHIGYNIKTEFRGHHYAYKACLLLKKIALSFSLTSLTITCNPDNYPSRKTIEKLEAVLLEIVDLPPDNEMYKQGERSKCRYLWQLV